MSTTQIQKIATDALHGLDSTHIHALTTAEIQALTTTQITTLTTDHISGFTTSDIAVLTTSQIKVLSTDVIHALHTDQAMALTTTDIAALTTDQIVAMTTDSLHALHLAGKQTAFTTPQMQVMDFPQLNAGWSSPIVLDLDGTGLHTVGAANGVKFDMSATGSHQNVGWVSGNTGFLVRDVNHDGVINNGSEMFGTATTLATGGKADNGYDALKSFDTNHDGVINSQDAVYNELKVWIDANHDGVSQGDEMQTLQSLGVTQLSLNATHTAVNNNGNWEILGSSYTTTDGQTHQMADVWFQSGTQIDISTMSTTQIAALTPDQVHTLTTDQIHAMEPTQVAAFTTADVAALTQDQVHALSTDQIHAMTPNQVAAFSTADIAALSHDQVQALTLDDVAALQELGKTDTLTTPQLQALVKPHLSQGLDDILFSGNVHVHTNVIAGSDQLQLIVTGDATGKVDLIGHPGDWKDAGTMLVNGAESHVYNNGHTQIVIQGSVTAIEKNQLLG